MEAEVVCLEGNLEDFLDWDLGLLKVLLDLDLEL